MQVNLVCTHWVIQVLSKFHNGSQDGGQNVNQNNFVLFFGGVHSSVVFLAHVNMCWHQNCNFTLYTSQAVQVWTKFKIGGKDGSQNNFVLIFRVANASVGPWKI